MMRKLYTLSHDKEYISSIDNLERRFTAAEYADILEKEFGNTKYKTKSSLLRYFLSNEFEKSISLKLLID